MASTDAIVGDGVAASPLALSHGSFCDVAHGSHGLKRGAALDAYRAFFREGLDPWGAAPTSLARVEESEADEGVVRKFLLGVPGGAKGSEGRASGHGLETESVIIPMKTRGNAGLTHTLCVSSQVGCAMGCGFCETAQMGLIRHLGVHEIVQQWWAATHLVCAKIKNIVFMGMGEPLDNYEGLVGSISVLTDHHGPAVPMRNITVSTVGRVDMLERLYEQCQQDGWKRLNLAVSVNAPNDEIRSQIMPINRAMPLGELVPLLARWTKKASDAICAEYVLIPGVNDADAHADELADLLKPVRCCINVIPYNPRRDSPWPAPEEGDVDRFVGRLADRGAFVKRRRTKGRDTMAACGQLGNEQIRGRRLVGVTLGEDLSGRSE